MLSNRKGVKIGNYIEDLAASSTPISSSNCPQNNPYKSTTQASFTPPPPSKPATTALREDLRLKYIKYGKSQPLGHQEPTESSFATMTHLSFGAKENNTHRQEQAKAASKPVKIQDWIWSGSNSANSKVPKVVENQGKAEERARKLLTDGNRSVYVPLEKEMLMVAAESVERANAKQPRCRPKTEGGQEYVFIC